MSPASICTMLANKDIYEKVKSKIVLQCAPFLKGLKVSAILNVESGECEVFKDIIRETDIELYQLASDNDKCLVLMYRRESFIRFLKKEGVVNFIREYGYKTNSIEKVLERLGKRVSSFKDNNIEFPHEIGAFLDYPLADVKGYIENQGKNSILTGYWQVYANPNRAKYIFNKYNQAKDKAIREYLCGKKISEIACMTA